jgi:transposase
VLRREKIKTISELRAVADHLERLKGIGPKRAQAIRAELARVASPDNGQSSGAP